uniref:Alpha-humulene synthase n=1 Tax=Picea glauca TaxID=3330 RepID=AHUMS_PICGL|nr:RecName: Full=Alpha-humulene synthase; AltName: Full=Terpene synthase TPS-Hum; Short=PgTPS-Hum [Picea glauca]ADZ45513.1 alpha-humulene synthase [Picea glauca]
MAQISESAAIPRRTANHHGNVWDDDLILSLDSPYGAPAYYERLAKLIEEMKHLLLREMEDSNHDLIRRLQIVDTLECLGIDRHFQHEIKTAALHYVYRCWNEKGIGMGSSDSGSKDLDATALGLRALRLHRYNVSSGVLENFQDENGKFFCNLTGDKRVRSMLSLLRASEISFPGEKVMQEAKAFTREYLTQVLAGSGDVTDVDQSLLREVKYALEFPWYCSAPRWEAKSFIEIYGQNQSWLKSNINQEVLELAKLDFSILQCIHQKEIQCITRWWRDSEIAQLNFYRRRHVELYFWAVTCIFEPEFSPSRIAFAKITTVGAVLDDLYDTHGTLDELKTITEAVRRWDLSLIDDLPNNIKIACQFFFNTANELAVEVVKKQGRDMTALLKATWQRYVESYLQEAEWIETRHVPSFNEYIKNALVSSGMCIVNLIPLLLLGQLLANNIVEQILSPSKIQELSELTIRLIDDIRDFEDEKERGEIASIVECYMKDNPDSTLENALNHIKGILHVSLEELNWEFMKDDSVPLCCKKFTFNIVRGLQFLYKYGDGISISNKEVKDQIFKILVDQIPIED